MPATQKMSISEIKEQVIRVEGFELKFDCGPRKLFETNLHPSRKTSDETRVADWITNNFPNAKKTEINVILATGKIASRMSLGQVRTSYPDNLRSLAKGKAKVESKVEAVKSALKQKKREVREVKGQVIKTIKEINVARRDGESEAGYDALEKALRSPDRYHPRVIELCQPLIKDESIETQYLIERILALWTHAEKERDRLEGTTSLRS